MTSQNTGLTIIWNFFTVQERREFFFNNESLLLQWNRYLRRVSDSIMSHDGINETKLVYLIGHDILTV